MLINCDTSSGSLPSCLVFGLGVKDQINRNILVLIKECDYDVRSMYDVCICIRSCSAIETTKAAENILLPRQLEIQM